MAQNVTDLLPVIEDNSTQLGADFDAWMGIRLPGLLCFLGILGNSLALLVLSRDPSRSASLMSLKALALSDLILLVSAVIQQIVPLWCLEALSRDALCLHQGYLRVYSWPVLCAAQMASIWFTVLVSAERFIAICRPLSAPRLCTFSHVRTCIIIITLASVFFNVVKFFEFESLAEFSPKLNATRFILSPTWLRQEPIYRYLYNTVLFCLVIYALPLSVLTVLNVKIVRRIKQARKEWQLLNRSQKREMKATTLPLVIVLVYFICGTQSLISFILDAVFVEFAPWLQIYTAVVNLLVIFNSAVNFFLMYCFGSRFRRVLKDTLCCTRANRHSSFHSSSHQRMLSSKG